MTEVATTTGGEVQPAVPGALQRSPQASAVFEVLQHYAPTLEAVLPNTGVTSEAFMGYVFTQVDVNPDLATAAAHNPLSFVQASVKAGLLGHVPDGVHGALVPYGVKDGKPTNSKEGPKVEFIEMYQGTLKRIRNANPGCLITAGVVYEHDLYESPAALGNEPRFIKGGRLENRPNAFVPPRARGAMVGAFAYAKYPDNRCSAVVELSEDEIVTKYQKTTTYNGETKPTKFWRDWPSEMRRKTALLRLETLLDTSTEAITAAGRVARAAGAVQGVKLPELTSHPDVYPDTGDDRS